MTVTTIAAPSNAPAVAATDLRCHIFPAKPPAGVTAPPPVRPDCDPLPSASVNQPPPPACNGGCGTVNYHGGPTVTSATEYFVWMNCPHNCTTDWGNPGGFLVDLLNSDFIHVLDQYMEGLFITTTSNRYTVHNNTCQVTVSSPPHVMQDSDLRNYLMSCVNGYYFPSGEAGGYNQMFSFFLPPGQDLCMGTAPNASCYCPDNSAQCTSTTGIGLDFCGYHNSFNTTDANNNPIHVIYQAMPYDDVSDSQTGYTCQVTNGPNGGAIDSENNIFSHEINETISDPDINAWWRTSDGNEIGDVCAWIAMQNPIYFNGDAYETQTEFSNKTLSCVGAYKTAALTHDFNFDMMSDILWRDTSGDLAMWLMHGGQLSSGKGMGTIPTTWSVVGTRDFNGDGTADILWLDTAGDIGIWLMNGTTISSTKSLGNVGTQWSVAGTGDFNGNGTGDVLWRNTSTGDVAVWLLSNGQYSSGNDLGTVSLTWQIVGTGDFTGGGTSDILWRNMSTGDLSIWFMVNGQHTSGTDLGNVPLTWSVVGTGDFNGDGMADILWRDTSGNLAIWLMNSGAFSSGATIAQVPLTWSVVETGDFNADAKSGIVWLDTSGNAALWQMNGLSVSATNSLGNVGTSWHVQGLGTD